MSDNWTRTRQRASVGTERRRGGSGVGTREGVDQGWGGDVDYVDALGESDGLMPAHHVQPGRLSIGFRCAGSTHHAEVETQVRHYEQVGLARARRPSCWAVLVSSQIVMLWASP